MTTCCPEGSGLSRRGLIKGAAALVGATSLVGSAVVTASPARAAAARSVLVVLSLRGAADGLSLAVPHGDPVYYQARPTISIPAERLLAADAMFGLHPSLSPLLGLWNSGRLAVVQATGLPVVNRSHFAAMEEVEDADPGSSTRVGWLNRLIGGDQISSPVQALSLGGGVVPTSLYGPQAVLAANHVSDVGIIGAEQLGRLRSLHTLWDGARSDLGRAMQASFTANTAYRPVERVPDRAAAYPKTDLGKALSQVARVIRGNVGVEVITVDQGDWDMHRDLGTVGSGRLTRNAADLAGSMSSFFKDLGGYADRVTMVVLSEFGRRVVENGGRGLDHGYGNAMFVAGAGVRSGYYGTWPGLSATADADLRVTTDYRHVLGEVVAKRFPAASLSSVFPGFGVRPLGFMT